MRVRQIRSKEGREVYRRNPNFSSLSDSDKLAQKRPRLGCHTVANNVYRCVRHTHLLASLVGIQSKSWVCRVEYRSIHSLLTVCKCCSVFVEKERKRERESERAEREREREREREKERESPFASLVKRRSHLLLRHRLVRPTDCVRLLSVPQGGSTV